MRLVLVTGQRPGEVCGARKIEIDPVAGVWTIPQERVKNRQIHVVPLFHLAKDLFLQAMALQPDSDFVFATRARAKDGISKQKPMESHALSHALPGTPSKHWVWTKSHSHLTICAGPWQRIWLDWEFLTGQWARS